MDDYLGLLPNEIYCKILLYVNSDDIKNLSKTNKYFSKKISGNNYFFYQYIKFNYDPSECGYEDWIYNKNVNWKELLNKLSSYKKRIRVVCGGPIYIYANDTISEIVNKTISVYNSSNNYPINAVVIRGKHTTIHCYYDGNVSLMYRARRQKIDILISLKTKIGTLFSRKRQSMFDDIDEIGIQHKYGRGISKNEFLSNINSI